jgi:predicted nucleic acid-binding protein
VITALDTNVLLDVFLADREHGRASRNALRKAYDAGGLVACEVVWAEVATFFPGGQAADEALERLGVRFVPMDRGDALEAAARWSRFRSRARTEPRRIAADFLIGAHALHHADLLLTRDRGFYRLAFRDLQVADPTAGAAAEE